MTKGSGLLAAYPEAMRTFHNAYLSERDIDDKTAVVFFFDQYGSGGEKDRNADGFMPRGKQFGYMFTQGFASEDDLYIGVAHELGHGMFQLKHPFDNDYKIPLGSTLNLMDYTPDATHIAKWQWDLIHDPGVIIRVFERDADAEISWTLIDKKHTGLFNYVYDKNLKKYNDTAVTPYKTNEWSVAWEYAKKKTEDLENSVIKKIRDTERNKIINTVTLDNYRIYVSKHKVGDTDYAVAIYSRKGKISDVKKVTVQDVKELKDDNIKQHLYCESTYKKYLVLAFYEENENEPALMIQAAKNELEVFSSEHLKAWMEYLGIMVDARDIIIENVRWISQFSSEINGRNCHWCGSSGLCCDGGSPCVTCPKDSTNKTKCCPVACTDSLQTTTCDSCVNEIICKAGTCKSNNCCFQTALAMIEQFGLTTNRAQAIDIATLKSNSSWKEQSDLQADVVKFNESITYIDETLAAGKPVLIGVHYQNKKDKLYNANKATLHYMVIVGKIHRNDKEYYWFYDPGTSDELIGKSVVNLLEIDKNKSMMYGIYKDDKPYTITEVRKNL